METMYIETINHVFFRKTYFFVVVELPSVKRITFLPKYREMYFNVNAVRTWSYETSS